MRLSLSSSRPFELMDEPSHDSPRLGEGPDRSFEKRERSFEKRERSFVKRERPFVKGERSVVKRERATEDTDATEEDTNGSSDDPDRQLEDSHPPFEFHLRRNGFSGKRTDNTVEPSESSLRRIKSCLGRIGSPRRSRKEFSKSYPQMRALFGPPLIGAM
jgi:hypothetical protein